MLSCYLCESCFESVRDLVKHLKFVHSLNNGSEFKCMEFSCGRFFMSLNSFKKHLNSHMLSNAKNTAYSSNTIPEISLSESNRISLHPVCSEKNVTFDESEEIPSNGVDIEISEIELFQDLVSSRVCILICQLYGQISMPRKEVQKIIKNFQDCFLIPLQMIKSNIVKSEFSCEKEEEKLLKMCSSLDKMFLNLNSEYHRFNYLESTEKFIKPQENIIGQHLVLSSKGFLKPQMLKYQFISFKRTLKCFFEMKNVLAECINNIKILIDEKQIISNLFQANLWKSKYSNSKNYIFPLLLYFDEFEVGNPLGAHAGIHKLGTIYYTIPIVPTKYYSELSNIFLGMLFHAADFKQFGSKILFTKLIEEINFLESTGIDIQIKDIAYNIKFKLALIQGDNLGLNTILGFSQGFRSNYFCRLCKIHRNDSKKQTRLDISLLRTRDSYNVCLYSVANILYNLVIADKIVGLETLNFKLKHFKYDFENKNKPPPFSEDLIKNRKIKMSSSEMLCFSRYFCIIAGDVISSDNEFWKLYLVLRKIIMLFTSTCIFKGSSEMLRQLITEHHTLYLKLFPGCDLTPKFHFMLHLPEMLDKVGPPVHLWSMRYEAKHKSLKAIANAVASRVNITKTIAIKHQLDLCNRFIQNRGFDVEISHGKSKLIEKVENLKLNDSLTENLIKENFLKHLIKPYFVNIFGTVYKEGNLIIVGTDNEMPSFAKIEVILINIEKEVGFIFEKCSTIHFNEHLQSYRFEFRSSLGFIPQKKLSYLHPILVTNFADIFYATLKHDFRYIIETSK